ncbi:MAG TPA: tetratricopeptide repeat protein [Myxococcota bacterium]|nr:tetratricopeptide repeat protein [Myxococcota bacterium]
MIRVGVTMRRRSLALALASLCAALACSSPEQRFADHLQRADAFLAKGQNDDALLELQSALKIHPDDANLNERLGRMLADRGNAQPAVFHLGEAYRLDPSRVDAAILQAQLVWRSAPPRAEQILRDLKQRLPDDPRVYRGESELAISMGDPARALAAATRARDLAPDAVDNWIALARAHVARIRALDKQKQPVPDDAYQAVLDALDRVDQIERGHVGARVEKALLYGMWPGHEKDARQGFQDALELAHKSGDPKLVAYAARNFGNYARGSGQPALRRDALRELVKADPSHARDWDELADVSGRLEGPQAAEAVYQEMLAALPDRAAAHSIYAGYLSSQGRTLDAIAHVDRAISDGLDEPELWELMLRLELSERRLKDAHATLKEMEDRHRDDPITTRARARLAIAENHDEEALQILQPLSGKSESAESERLRAIAHMDRGEYAAATSAIQRALALAPRDALASLRVKASIHDKAGEWQESLRILNRLAAAGKLDPSEELMRVRALYGAKKPDDARKALEALLAEPQPEPEAAVEYAKREGAEHPQSAHKYLVEAFEQAPGNYDVLEALTLTEIRTGQAQPALARLDKLVQSQLASPRVLLLRAETLAAAGQLDRAEADALRAFEAAPQLPRAVDLLYAIYVAENKVEEARRSFEEAESVGVLHDGARILLGRLYLVEGMNDKARETYEKVLAKDPNSALAKSDLAFLLASTGEDLARATTLAEEAQKALPDHPAVADTVGFVYLQNNRQDAALQQFRYALELARNQSGPESPIVHYHLGLSLLAEGRKQEAADAFQRALDLNPDFPGSSDARRLLEEARHAPAAPPAHSAG